LIRALFLAWVPAFLGASDLIVFIIDAIIVILDLFINIAIGIIDAIIAAVALLGGGGLSHAHFINWVWIKVISFNKVNRAIRNVAATCRSYNNAGIIIQFLVRYNVHEYTCPAVRYVYPMQWLYNVCVSVLSWTYYGSAAPITDAPSKNCEMPGQQSADYICVGLGIGFILIEVLLPIFLVYILITQLGRGIGRIAWTMIILVFYVGEYLFDLVTYILRTIES